MKVKEYREMMKYLTRPGTPDQGQKDMETQVKKSVENNKNPGTFKKLVKEDEAANRKKNVQGYLPGMEPERVNKIIDTYSDNDPGMEKRGQQTIALTNTANKHLNNQIKKGNVNKDDYILKEDRNGLMVNKIELSQSEIALWPNNLIKHWGLKMNQWQLQNKLVS